MLVGIPGSTAYSTYSSGHQGRYVSPTPRCALLCALLLESTAGSHKEAQLYGTNMGPKAKALACGSNSAPEQIYLISPMANLLALTPLDGFLGLMPYFIAIYMKEQRTEWQCLIL